MMQTHRESAPSLDRSSSELLSYAALEVTQRHTASRPDTPLKELKKDSGKHSHTNSSSDESGSRVFSPWRSSSGCCATSPGESINQGMSPFGGVAFGPSMMMANEETGDGPTKWPSQFASQPTNAQVYDRANAILQSSGSFGPLDDCAQQQMLGDVPSMSSENNFSLSRNPESFVNISEAFGVKKVGFFSPWQPESSASVQAQQAESSVQGTSFIPTEDVKNLKPSLPLYGQGFERSAAEMHRTHLENMRLQANERFDDWVNSTEVNRSASNKALEDDTTLVAHQLAPHAQQAHGPAKDLNLHNVYDPIVDGQTLREMPASVVPSPFYPCESQKTPEFYPPFKAHCSPAVISPLMHTYPASGGLTWESFEGQEPEYSVFVGDLCPDLREEDLVMQFRHPPYWPPSHPFAVAHAHAQQAQGNYGSPPKIGPAPFATTKSATIMTDPLTGASRGFGFVRFSTEADCARALVEMQGIIVQPSSGQGGRPLRVCPATPKNRSSSNTPGSGMGANAMYPHVAQNGGASNAHMAQGTGLSAEVLARLSAKAISSANAAVKASTLAKDSCTLSSSTGAFDPGNTTVFVGGLSSLISEDTLKTFFVPFGEIKYVKIPPGKGCGFVQFVKKADAERAIERMQGFPIGGGRIRLSWGRSQGDKAAAAAAQAAQQAAQIGHLAGLAGLSASSTSQVTAASLAATASGMTGNDSHSLLMKRLAAAASDSSTVVSPASVKTDAESGYDLFGKRAMPADGFELKPPGGADFASLQSSQTFEPFVPFDPSSQLTGSPIATRNVFNDWQKRSCDLSDGDGASFTDMFSSLRLGGHPGFRENKSILDTRVPAPLSPISPIHRTDPCNTAAFDAERQMFRHGLGTHRPSSAVLRQNTPRSFSFTERVFTTPPAALQQRADSNSVSATKDYFDGFDPFRNGEGDGEACEQSPSPFVPISTSGGSIRSHFRHSPPVFTPIGTKVAMNSEAVKWIDTDSRAARCDSFQLGKPSDSDAGVIGSFVPSKEAGRSMTSDK